MPRTCRLSVFCEFDDCSASLVIVVFVTTPPRASTAGRSASLCVDCAVTAAPEAARVLFRRALAAAYARFALANVEPVQPVIGRVPDAVCANAGAASMGVSDKPRTSTLATVLRDAVIMIPSVSPLLGGLEERVVAGDAPFEVVAQRERGGVVLPLVVGAGFVVLERVHDQADVRTARIAQRHQDDELLHGIVRAVPARVDDRDPLRRHVDVVGIVGVADPLRERA